MKVFACYTKFVKDQEIEIDDEFTDYVNSVLDDDCFIPETDEALKVAICKALGITYENLCFITNGEGIVIAECE